MARYSIEHVIDENQRNLEEIINPPEEILKELRQVL